MAGGDSFALSAQFYIYFNFRDLSILDCTDSLFCRHIWVNRCRQLRLEVRHAYLKWNLVGTGI